MITAIICSFLVGILVTFLCIMFSPDPYPFSFEDLERERRVRAEHEATRMYFELENMRRDNLNLSSHIIYRGLDYGYSQKPLEIKELPLAMSLDEAKEKYGEYYNVTDAIIGKVNEVVSEVNRLKRLEEKK